ncbi:hypothetical protein KDL01_10075 [Actinospica durhamensis]|uniref:Uncharacterized protein n=1 Tax=Actinospica durhamensis TaxID=1508375 RepID=A0A941ENG8_9ACTN|nr:hypothetical protein [Actinospica durhamensis]MBR7833613.1 hypothetical protein [Actinospica durhamensis]
MASTTSEGVDSVIAELSEALNDATATVGFAQAGLRQLTQFVATHVTPSAENPDPMFYLGISDPNLPDSATYANWRVSKLLRQIELNGPVDDRLGHQWIVMFFAKWDEELRPRLAAAHGCEPRDIKVPLLGDLRLLRNAVVHERGISPGFGEVLRWFDRGAPIAMGGWHYAEFHRLFPWEALRTRP